MKAEILRSSILQWAIEGKLVPQLDTEPEVAQIGDAPENIPFAIPEKWKWIPIEKIFTLCAGKFITASEIKLEGAYPCYGGNGVRGYVDRYNREGRFPIIGRQGALCGNINIADGLFYATEHAVVVDCHSFGDPDCVGFFLQAMNLNQYATATAQPGLAVKNINKLLFPLPPLAEQRRIVARLNELLPLVAAYGQEQKALEKIEKELPDKLRASLLQEAIQGKLVPQLDTEPEVAQIGDTPENIPFAIPEKWKWVKVDAISNKLQYGYTSSAIPNGNIKFLRITDITNSGVDWNSVPTCNIDNQHIEKFKLEEDDILIARTGGTIGKSYRIKTTGIVSVFASYLIRLRVYREYITPEYMEIFLGSPWYWMQLDSKTRGTGQPNVNAKSLGQLAVPLPPLAEQRRIVARLNELLAEVDRLKA